MPVVDVAVVVVLVVVVVVTLVVVVVVLVVVLVVVVVIHVAIHCLPPLPPTPLVQPPLVEAFKVIDWLLPLPLIGYG